MKNILIVSLFCLIIAGCRTDKAQETPDVSHIEIDSKVVRFEQLMSALDTNNLAAEVQALNEAHTAFYSVFFRNVLPFDTKTEEGFLTNLRGYLSDNRIQKLQDTTALIFSDFEAKVLPDLEQSFRLMKHYFPAFTPPSIYTFISEYTYQQFLFSDEDRDGVGIGLDMFLGASYPYKELDPKNPAFSQYLTRTFNTQHLPKKIMDIIIGDVIGRPPGSRLIDQMIHNGKQLYILDRVLPSAPDSVLLEYTDTQTKWVENNEISMWSYFFDEKLFYESNAMKINKYINPSPSSPGMPEQAPGRTANYIGWKIVEAYMAKKSDLSIQQLVDEKDTQKIMDESRYKPKRRRK